MIKSLLRKPNTDNKVNKLVMVFAGCCNHDKSFMVLSPGRAPLLPISIQ